MTVMAEEQIESCISIRSNDADKRRLCDLVFTKDGHIYLIDVENDQKRGKKKYIARIDSYEARL